MKTCVLYPPHGPWPRAGAQQAFAGMGIDAVWDPPIPAPPTPGSQGPRHMSPPLALTPLHPLTCSENLGEGPAGWAASLCSRNTSFSQA